MEQVGGRVRKAGRSNGLEMQCGQSYNIIARLDLPRKAGYSSCKVILLDIVSRDVDYKR